MMEIADEHSGFPFYSKTEENRKFWMTSCGHMLCGTREHNREPPHAHLLTADVMIRRQ